jgi:predicted HTH domain antitoxin
MVCKKCFSKRSVKNGMVRTKQRYRCCDCGYNFVAGDKRQKISPEGKALAILLYGRGKASYGIIAKLLKVSPVAVMKLIKREAGYMADQYVSPSEKEVDFEEILNFVNKKKESFNSGGLWSAFEISPSAGISGLIILRHPDDSQ